MKNYINKLFYFIVLLLGLLGIYLLISYKPFADETNFIVAITLPFLIIIFYKYFNSIHIALKVLKALLVGLALFYSSMLIGHRFIYFTEVQNNRKVHSQSAVNFEKDNFQASLQKAKKENKLIFLDIYTGWCGPCLHFSKTVLKDREVSQVLNSKFINLKYDAEVGEGIEVNKKYNKRAYPSYIYPTLLILDSDGNIKEDIGEKYDTPDIKTMQDLLKKYN